MKPRIYDRDSNPLARAIPRKLAHWSNTLCLRGHLRLYMGAMLLLMILVGTTSYFSLQFTVEHFRTVAQREMNEARYWAHLRDLSQATIRQVYRHAGAGDPVDADGFAGLALEIDRAFTDMLTSDSVDAGKWPLLLQAQAEWERARVIGAAVLDPRRAGGDERSLAARRFEDRMARVLDLLREAGNLRLDQVEARKESVARRYELTRLVLLAGLLGGIAIAVTAGRAMSRHILTPIETLKRGLARFGQGDLSHRVSIGVGNELGELAAGFNAMAARLEQDRAALKNLASRDGLTGLYNRRRFDQLLTEELYRAQRYHHPLALLLIDVDEFKHVNDTCGHQAGDDILRGVAAVIRALCRQGDAIARYGGDEFAVLLPETAGEDALALADRMCRAIAGWRADFGNGVAVAATVSIGVAAAPLDAATPEILVECADLGLYAAKAAGRNCVRRHRQALLLTHAAARRE